MDYIFSNNAYSNSYSSMLFHNSNLQFNSIKFKGKYIVYFLWELL